jgi:hypothetical protein
MPVVISDSAVHQVYKAIKLFGREAVSVVSEHVALVYLYKPEVVSHR